MAAGGATHAAVAVDLGHLEIRVAVSVRQAHLYSPVLRGEWHTPNRDIEPAGAQRRHGAGQQVGDAVTSKRLGVPLVDDRLEGAIALADIIRPESREAWVQIANP